jgi:tRNA(Arg) A34 adenosine deaminase TadA
MMNKEEDIRFIGKAVKLAVENVHSGGGPFGAVIVKEGKVISTGVNRVTGNNDPTAHAEVMAIRKAAENLETHILQNCTIYSSSEPCPMCLGAIYWAGLKRLVYASSKSEAEKAGFIDAHIYREMDLEADNRKLLTEQIITPEAGSEFEAWNMMEDKKLY